MSDLDQIRTMLGRRGIPFEEIPTMCSDESGVNGVELTVEKSSFDASGKPSSSETIFDFDEDGNFLDVRGADYS